ncbi:MAG: peptidoglycan editing factor PgeF, partial [Tepidisphaeraceae bacterium]
MINKLMWRHGKCKTTFCISFWASYLLRVYEQRHADGLVLHCSGLLDELGVPHAFTTRLGGVSSGPFASLNLGNPSGELKDDADLIAQNYHRVHSAIGCARHTRAWVHQVHGGEVVRMGRDSPNAAPADAMITDEPQTLLAVRTADCAPILLASDDGRIVAAIHAGWRGVVARIVENTIRTMHFEPAQLTAAVGPCIGLDAFEVGTEVIDAFRRDLGSDAPVRSRHVDLREALRMQLLRAGVRSDRIDVSDRCTVRD